MNTMDEHWRADMRLDSQLATAIRALADVAPSFAGLHSRLTIEDALAAMQEERARIVRRWD